MPDQPTGAPSSDDTFWCANKAELLSKLGTSAAGLSGVEAERRLRAYGRNVVAEPVRRRILGKILRRLIEPLPYTTLDNTSSEEPACCAGAATDTANSRARLVT
jgi:hypothetical protein